jgi:FkbM family methyltransferase
MVTDRALAQALLCENFAGIGRLDFPYVKMGNIDSLHLFGVDELIILAFYKHNRYRYHLTADIGANLGLHTLFMMNMGWHVEAFEPDPEIYQKLVRNLDSNMKYHAARNMAVYTSTGEMSFVRVEDNLTGSHLIGCKDSYGPRTEITVKTMDCRDIFDRCDFAKIDCEGAEAEILMTTTPKQMGKLDVMCEVRDLTNALKIMHHFNTIEVPMWSQKNGWNRVNSINDMPQSSKEGSLFIGHREPFP